MTRNLRPSTPWYLAALLAVVATLSGASCDMPLSRSEQCKADGNTVQAEPEYDKSKKRYYTEYECVTPDGTEVDEWR